MAYPPGPEKLVGLPDLAGGQAPGDLAYLVDVSAAAGNRDRQSTLNDLFETITKNITSKVFVYEDSDATRAVSAANTGKFGYSVTNQSFQVSENGGAFQNLIKGIGANTRVAFWTDPDTLSSDSAFLWDSGNDRLLINVSVANGAAPIDVLADASAIGQRWRENAGATRVEMQVPSSFGQLGTSSAHDFALMSNGTARINIESGGAVVVGAQVVATAELMVNALATGSISLIANNLTGTSVDIARFQVNGSNRFRFLNTGEAIFGLASTTTGKLTLSNASGATLTSLSAGNAASTLNFIWPVVDPTAGQLLSAAAPSGGNVVMSWVTGSGSTSPSAPTGSIQFNDGGVFGGDAAALWDDTAKQLLIGGIALGAGAAPIDVVADSGAIAQQWRENGAGTARVQMQVPSSFGQLGTSSAHDFALMSNGTARINIESGGAVVVGAQVVATAELMVNALATGSISLIANNLTGTSVDIARFQVNGSNRFRFLNTGEAIFGLASTTTGKLTLSNASGATLTSISAGNAASTLNFIWPVVDPTAGQFLQAAAPSGGNVTLSWATGSGSTSPSSPTGSIQFNDGGVFGGDAAALWDDTAKQLLIGGIALGAGAAPIDVVADSGAIAQQWRENGAGTARVQMQVPSSFGQLGTSSAHDFALMSNGTARINIESGGAVVVGAQVVATAELMVNALATGSISLIANNLTGTSVDIARFQVNGSNRFRFLNTGEAILGLASTATGKLTLSNASGATLTSLSAGNAASTLNFILPVVDPTAGQVLSAAAPSGGNVTLSWVANGSPTLTATQIGFGDGSNLLSGSTRLIWDNTNRSMTLGESGNSGSTFITLRSTNTASAFISGSAAVAPGSQGGLLMPNVGGDQTQGPGITWSDGNYNGTSRLYISLGLNWQGYDTAGQALVLRKSTATSSQGAVVFEFRPNDGYLQINPFGTSAGNTTEVRFLELAASGTNYVSLRGPDAVGATNPVIVLPSSSAPSTNDVLTVTGVSSGVITTAWQAGGGGGGANTALSNLASVSINTSLIPQTGVDLGGTSEPFKILYLYGAGSFGANRFAITGTPTAARTITIPDATGTLVMGSNSTAGAIPQSTSNVLSDSIMVASASPATITTTGRHVISGLSLNADANNTVGSLDLAFSLSKNDANSRTFFGQRIIGTLNPGGSNASTTINMLYVDTVNTATTGTTTNLLQLRYGGNIMFNVGSGGDITFAEARQVFAPNATISGLNVGFVAGDPSSLVDGDLWYNSVANALRARINGATVSLGAGGGSQTPWTSNIDADGFSLLVDDGTGIFSSESGNPELLKFTSVASAVNEFTITNAATGNAPIFSATGGDTNIGITLTPKGTGNLTLSANTLILPNGTSGTPSTGFASETNLGIYRAAASQFGISGALKTSGFIWMASSGDPSIYMRASGAIAFNAPSDTLIVVSDASTGFRDFKVRQYFADATISATSGNQTINKSLFQFVIAAGQSNAIITNSLITTSSLVFCTVATNDTTLKAASAVVSSGSVQIFGSAAATADCKINVVVFNN